METFLHQIEHGNSNLLDILLKKEVLVVGSDLFPLLCRYPHVSSHHAKFTKKSDDQWYVEDLGSTHGTYVNGIRLDSLKKRVILIGDHIGFGVSRVNEGFLCSLSARNKTIVKKEKDEAVDCAIDRELQKEEASIAIKSEPSDDEDIVLVGVRRVEGFQHPVSENLRIKKVFQSVSTPSAINNELLVIPSQDEHSSKVTVYEPLDQFVHTQCSSKVIKCEPLNEEEIVCIGEKSLKKIPCSINTQNNWIKKEVNSIQHPLVNKPEFPRLFTKANSLSKKMECQSFIQRSSEKSNNNLKSDRLDKLTQQESLNKVIKNEGKKSYLNTSNELNFGKNHSHLNLSVSSQGPVNNSFLGGSDLTETNHYLKNTQFQCDQQSVPSFLNDYTSTKKNFKEENNNDIQSSISTANNGDSYRSDDDDVVILPDVEKKSYSCNEEIIHISDDESNSNSSVAIQSYFENKFKFKALKKEYLLKIFNTISKIVPESTCRDESSSEVPVTPVLNDGISSNVIKLNEECSNLISDRDNSSSNKSFIETRNSSLDVDRYLATEPDGNDNSDSSVSSQDYVIFPTCKKRKPVTDDNQNIFNNKPSGESIKKKRNDKTSKTKGDKSCDIDRKKLNPKKSSLCEKVDHPSKINDLEEGKKIKRKNSLLCEKVDHPSNINDFEGKEIKRRNSLLCKKVDEFLKINGFEGKEINRRNSLLCEKGDHSSKINDFEGKKIKRRNSLHCEKVHHLPKKSKQENNLNKETVKFSTKDKILESRNVVKNSKLLSFSNLLESSKVIKPSKVMKSSEVVKSSKMLKSSKVLEPSKMLKSSKVLEPSKKLQSPKIVESSNLPKSCDSIIIKSSITERNKLSSFKIPKKSTTLQVAQETSIEDSKKRTSVVCKQSKSRSSFLVSDVLIEQKDKISKINSPLVADRDTKSIVKKKDEYQSPEFLSHSILYFSKKQIAKENKRKRIFLKKYRCSDVKNVTKPKTSRKGLLPTPPLSTHINSKIPCSRTYDRKSVPVKSASKGLLPIPRQINDSSYEMPAQSASTSNLQMPFQPSPYLDHVQSTSESILHAPLHSAYSRNPHALQNRIQIENNFHRLNDPRLQGSVEQLSFTNVPMYPFIPMEYYLYFTNSHNGYPVVNNFDGYTSSIPIDDLYHTQTREAFYRNLHPSPTSRHAEAFNISTENGNDANNSNIYFFMDYQHVSKKLPTTLPDARNDISTTQLLDHVNQKVTNFPITTEYLIQRIVELNYQWLKEQQQIEEPPVQITSGVKKLPLHFSSFSEYASSFIPMLMLEVWETLQEESKPLWQKPELCSNRFNFTIHSQECRSLMTVYHCQALIYKDSFCPQEGNVLLMEVEDVSREFRISMLGYIFSAHIHGLVKCAPTSYCDEENATMGQVWRFSVYVKQRNFQAKLNEVFSVNGICSVKRYINLIGALQNLALSPLLDSILQPNLASVSATSLKTAVKSITEKIEAPTPKIVLLEGSPGPSKTHFIVNLIENLLLAEDSKHRAVVTVSSRVVANEIGHKLMLLNEVLGQKHQIKFMLIGCFNQVSDKLQQFTFDYFREELIQTEILLKQLDVQIDRINNKNRNSRNSRQKLLNEKKSIKERLFSKIGTYSTNKCDILKNFSVVITTLDGFYKSDLPTNVSSIGSFSCCIVEDATQCTELELLQAVYNTEKLILIGDLQHANTIVRSKLASNYRYGLSMFERFMEYL